METITWKVEGMTCSNCALTIGRFMEAQGAKQVKVNLVGGEVNFEKGHPELQKLQKGLASLGYEVYDSAENKEQSGKKPMNRFLKYVLFCLPFTLVLMLHMIPGVHIEWLMNPWVQLVLCTPVYILGMYFFGKSALNSLRNGLPNMNVLITLGATAAFAYSLTGSLMGWGENFLFYETTATIITLVFLGNYVEEATIQSTQRALNSLASSQKVMANMIAFDDKHEEVIFPMENTQLRSGDLVLIRSGEQVPADCKILWGEASVNEALLTGESLPVDKKAKDKLLGGSVLASGSVKAQVLTEASNSVLANIVNLVKRAQGERPPVQQLADKISAIFVPVVIGIALLTFILNYIFLQDFTESLMRCIAVLVIACPCAMGLATPAAIAVGLGRAAKSGILFRDAKSLELFKNISQVVFDKTGTLTTGKFKLESFQILDPTLDETSFKTMVYSLEKYSAHPLAEALTNEWKQKETIRWKSVEEIKGLGVKAVDKEGNEYVAGSYQVARKLTENNTQNIYVVKNGNLIGTLLLEDEVREEAAEVVTYFRSKKIHTILLSGDNQEKCEKLAAKLGIDEVMAEKKPEEKLEIITNLTATQPTAMVGDGINDAPSLAKATVGISLSKASQLAMQTASVVLMDNGLKNLPKALGLGKHTYITIRQNLGWAFMYNIIAIPVAALGFLVPMFAALVMGFSDVVLAINSVRLYVKKVF